MTTPSNEQPIAPIAGALPKSAQLSIADQGIKLNTVEDAFRFAQALIKSGLAPKDFRTQEAVLIAIQMGAEIGLAPMASLQNIAVINGKPGVYGDAGKALLRAKGFDIEEAYDGTKAICTITHERQKPVTRHFSIEDAKRAGLWGKQGPWSQYPTRMLAWRAFWWAARDAAADVLKGVGGVEEIRDVEPAMKDVTPPPVAQRLAALDAPVEPAPVATVEPEPAPSPTVEPQPEEKPAAPAYEGDKQSLVDVIEGLMLDHEVGEKKLADEAKKAGHEVPERAKKLTDYPDATLLFMRDYLRGLKK